ncbi:MAG: exo-beta-N-acetylmuramidase NamZ domain-containing protein, partial [Pirellulaceae bacterium]
MIAVDRSSWSWIRGIVARMVQRPVSWLAGWLMVAWLAQIPGVSADGLEVVAPEMVGMDGGHLARIDGLVEEALAERRMPGCVVCVGRRGKIVFLRAYGHRQVEPQPEPMTVDTVFDMASITKPVATATSVMLLIERGKLRLADKVTDWIPEFAENEKGSITVRDLLIHQSGLLPDNALSDYAQGPDEAMKRIYALKLQAPTGTKFIYSDVNYILLGELIRRASGQPVDVFIREQLFAPLGMTESGYLPPVPLRQRAAPTEQREGQWIQGEVHDPRAFKLGGVAGHAGLFSTARDLAIYAQMMLNRGEYDGVRVLAPRTVATMTRGEPVPGGIRGLGWDKRTGYSSNRGELLTESAFGHGGFTGTVLWVDPQLELFYIFLSNRVHPNGKGLVNPLAGRIGSVAAAAIRDAEPASAPAAPVLTGIDVLARDGFRQLAGRRVGLITNHTGRSHDGQSTVERFHASTTTKLVSLFSPEHGFAGALDVARISDSRDERTGLVIHSLYGETRRPTAAMLADIDTLVFDIQDIGCRFYTYVSTMGEAMQAAAEHGKRFVVLDRPNPINGLDVAGPMLDPGEESFVGFHRLPVRHGMTVGELARLIRDERKIDVELDVIACEGWRRADYYDATGLTWINPSPNMRSLTQALLYPGVGLLETTNLSVGRGTDTPFQVVGAPWLDGVRLAQA